MKGRRTAFSFYSGSWILNSGFCFSSDFRVAGAAVRAPLGVERSAIAATVIHPAREPVGDERADDENAAENSYGKQRIFQALYFSRKLWW